MSEPPSPGKRGPARFADLGTRAISAAGMLVLGATAIWFGVAATEAKSKSLRRSVRVTLLAS